MSNEPAPAGGVPVDPPEPREQCPECDGLGLHDMSDEPHEYKPCSTCNDRGWVPAPAAGGVVQPPADREVEALALDISEFRGWRVNVQEYHRRFAAYLHGRGWRRVPEGHQVVPDGRVWLDGQEYEVTSWTDDEHGVEGEFVVSVRPVGAAGGEGTDGD